jgi:hypothetical protein
MATSIIYKSNAIYELIMLALYGRHYPSRHQAIAELIPSGSTVLELCCGPSILFRRYLKPKSVRYTGIDLSERFVRQVSRCGGIGLLIDLREDQPLPRADYVIMQGSLFHFLPDASRIIDRTLRAARKQVIIAEPVRNLASSKWRFLAWVAAHLTNPGVGPQPSRFTQESLNHLFSSYRSLISQSSPIGGGREIMFVLNVETSQAGSSDYIKAALRGSGKSIEA